MLVLYNARINLRKRIRTQAFLFGIMEASQTSATSAEAAKKLRIPAEAFIAYCTEKKLDTPEVRKEKSERERLAMEAEEKRILEEETAWVSEQQKLVEEQHKRQEEEARSA